MNKRMKRAIALALCLAATMMTLAGCGKHTCDLCGDKASCKKYEILGQKVYICNNCQDELSSWYY